MTEPRLILGDCVEALAAMEASSIDAVVCDPPYLISFMGKEFDSQDGAHADPKKMQGWHELWAREALRVMKPGGYLLAFGGTRTYHRLAAGIEDAGFEIRDCIMWLYGSGFPKSLDVAKAIDRAQGVEREDKFEGSFTQRIGPTGNRKCDVCGKWLVSGDPCRCPRPQDAAVSEDARTWEGWGTALKPAVEPIVVARKPLIGTVTANVLEYGTGAINVDACRVAFVSDGDERESKEKNRHGDFGTEQGGNAVYGDYSMLDPRANYDAPGRWPANVLLTHTDECVRVGDRQVVADGHWPAARPAGSELAGATGHVGQDGLVEREASGETVAVWECSSDCPMRLLDEQSGVSRSSGGANGGKLGERIYGDFANETLGANAGGLGASRFFYCAKTSRAERNAGLDGFDAKSPGTFQSEDTEREVANDHPTVKPVDLMRWLVRLVARPGAVVCDPFLGSGTTGIACGLEAVDFVGIEREADYLAIADARMRFWAKHGRTALRIVAERDGAERQRRARADAGQLDLFA